MINVVILILLILIIYKIIITNNKHIHIIYDGYIFFIDNEKGINDTKINYNLSIENFDKHMTTKFNLSNSFNDRITLMYNIIKNLYKLRYYLYLNIKKYDKYKKYILLLYKNFNNKRTKFYETDENTNLTSYTINKGEIISLCLINKSNNTLHDYNLLMYVSIHELAHVACPDIGHGQLFYEIFKFFILSAIDINIYKYDNLKKNPREYCGIQLNSYILE